jgi:5-methylcytosine-specific restriction endonuclease McrA
MNATKFTKSKMAALVAPHPALNVSAERREKWLKEARDCFVNPSKANREKYSVILEALWPIGHGIPGPILSQDDIRRAIDAFQRQKNEEPYKDPFRRLRELQGEEGFLCIAKEGVRYQLISISLGTKRTPRAKLTSEQWKEIQTKHRYRCAVCGLASTEVRLNQDHKIPRTKDGGNDLENWQPLCDECNNIKSTQCRGCSLNCYTCSWAFPEVYPRLQIQDSNKELLLRAASDKGVSASEMLNKLIEENLSGQLSKRRKS